MASVGAFIITFVYGFLHCYNAKPNRETPEITATCFEPLGISDGRIKNSQLHASSAFHNDFNTFGPHRARLNITSWPQGYRSATDQLSSSWFKVEIGRIMVITGIATQGYGDVSVNEWLTAYILLYSQGKEDYTFFRERNGNNAQMFMGNHDSNTIQLNRVILPAKASSVMLRPISWTNNFAVRMELYGCHSDYYVVVWLMLANSPFTIEYLESWDDHRKSRSTAAGVEQEVTNLLKNILGFLSTRVLHFSPQESEKDGAMVKAQVLIECLREGQANILNKLIDEISSRHDTSFDTNFFTIQYAANEVDLLANVSLNLSKNLQTANEILTEERYRVEARISVKSGLVNSTSKKYDFKWEIFTIDEATGQFYTAVELKLNNETNIVINSEEMSKSLTLVRVSVKPKGFSTPFSYDYGFIKILPRLTVTVSGPDLLIKGGQPVQLLSDVKGILRDSFGAKAEKKNFFWTCWVEDSTSPNLLFPFTSVGENHKNTTECFVGGNLIKNTSNENLVFEADLLLSMRTYVFQVMVSQGRRFATASHKLRADTNISFAIKCVANCGQKVSIRKKFMFDTQCEGISCSAIKNYSWSLYVRLENGSHKSWGEINNLYTIALTSLNGPNLIFNGGDSSLNRSLLMGNKTYKIHIIAWIDGNSFRTDEHIFRTNSPPSRRDSNSGCFMEPRIGNAIETEFKISCVNWSDPDTPLSYQFSYQTNFGIVVFYTGWQPNVTTELPEGSKASNYSLYLKLQIIDSLGDSSLELITAQVWPPKASSVEDSQRKLDNLLESGDVNKAMQIAFSVLSAAGDSVTFSSIKFKNALLQKMTTVKIGSLQQATMVVGVVALATDSDNGISSDSQDNALSLLGNAANLISTELSSGSVDSDLIESIGTSLFSGIGNVLDAASSEAQTDTVERDEIKPKGSNEAEKVAMKEKSKQRARSSLNLVSRVAGSLLSTKDIGGEPTEFKTKSLKVLLDRQKSSNMGGKKLGQGPSGVALPSADSLFSGGKPPENIDSQV
ncbi:unnamed protein product, partial [Porites evermanni]